ncbi:hypothetical protein R4P80_01665, partial [Rhodococcus sp. IEGM 69]|nr:hypothetical protein [Rhodococcus sp. IEGM 69]
MRRSILVTGRDLAFEQLSKLLDGDLHGAEHGITLHGGAGDGPAETAYRGNSSRSVTLISGPHPFQPSGSGNFAAASWNARTIAAEIRPRNDTLRPSPIAQSRISLVVAFAGAVPAAAPVTGAFFTAVASAADSATVAFAFLATIFSAAAAFATVAFATDVFAGAFLTTFFSTAIVSAAVASAADSTAAVFTPAVFAPDVFAGAFLATFSFATFFFTAVFFTAVVSAAVVFGAVVFAGA